ncbi:MAG TPA: tetratricopeptide repeat protein, partial [Bacteroidales bacterium]|nr:tetratricopeptide repeat protein [Bacteroidales bacterium]
MIRTVHLCILLIIICRGNITLSQINDVYNLFLKYQELVYKGDFINAQGYMISVIECNDTLPLFYRAAAYNNLGLIKRNLGLYNEALNYYNIAENISLSKSITYSILADIYINKSRIFTFYKSYN